MSLQYIIFHYIPLNYTTINYTTLHPAPFHFITLHSSTPHYNYSYTNYITYVTLHPIPLGATSYTNYNATATTSLYTTLGYTTQPYITLHYTHCTTNATATMLHQAHYHNYNSTTPQLQLQLRYTRLHSAAACRATDQVSNHCNHSKNHNPQPPFSPAADSLCHP